MGEQAFGGERFLDRTRRGGGFDDALVAVRAGVFRADRFDDHETRRFVFQLLGHVLADARPGVATRTLFLRIRHVDFDAASGQVGGQRAAPRRPSTRVPADWRLARTHFHRFGDGPAFVGELLQRELQLPRIDAFGFPAKEALTEDVELVPEGGDLTLGRRELLLQRGDEGACRGEIVDRVTECARLIIHLQFTTSTRAVFTGTHYHWGVPRALIP